MFKILFKIALQLCGTLIQIVTLPINLVITGLLPDFSSQIVNATRYITQSLSYMSWAVSIIPNNLLSILLFIITTEIALFTMYISLRATLRVWEVVQKIKFW